MMRIALFHNLPSGGAKRHTLEQVRELSIRGHSVSEYAPSTADLNFCSMQGVVEEQHIYNLAGPNIYSRRVPFFTPYIHAWQGLRALTRADAVYRQIAAAIDRAGFDLVFVKDCQIMANPSILRYLETPTVFQCHHALSHRARDHGALSNGGMIALLRSMYYRPAKALFDERFAGNERRTARAASLILTNSSFSKELLAKAYGVDAHVVYPGINRQVFRRIPEERSGYVLSVGSLIHKKGYRFLVSSLSLIPEQNRPPLLVVANSVDARELEILQDQANRSGVELDVQTVFDDHEMAAIYNRASVFVYAPIEEALGMAALEAMACACPVVAVGEGGVRETVVDGETGYLVPRDAEIFAARVRALLADPELSERMGQAGIEWVRSNWTWEHAVDRLEQEFQTVLDAELA